MTSLDIRPEVHVRLVKHKADMKGQTKSRVTISDAIENLLNEQDMVEELADDWEYSANEEG